MTEFPDWWIYHGDGIANDRLARLPDPPPWRRFDRAPAAFAPAAPTERDPENSPGLRYRPDPGVVELVNAAILLRRPLLVTGKPGTGKSTLAVAIAHELGLGEILRWNITSRTTLRDGLYQYDSMGRLVAASGPGGVRTGENAGQFIRLGPLGTALLPNETPRALLIDEIDKGDLDLPNDLLAVFEDGSYPIPELARETAYPEQTVMTADDRGDHVKIIAGIVRCYDFPIVVMTSNDEREFPPAFLRRCIQINLAQPGDQKLAKIVGAHLGDGLAAKSRDLIETFLSRQNVGELATDQLLNAIYLTDAAQLSGIDRTQLAERIMTNLSRRGDER